MKDALRSQTPISSNLPLDAQEALETAQKVIAEQKDMPKEMAVVVRDEEGNERKIKKADLAFLERLKRDGGDKIITFKRNYIHVEHTRFIPLLSQIRGLPLDQALLQIKWLRKKISLKLEEAMEGAIVKAKESGLELSKTYIADGYVKKNAAVLSKPLQKRYIRGRGRYGATPHPKTCLLELTLQERNKPFDRKLADPLEWIRARLRDRLRPFTKSPDEVYEAVKTKRPPKFENTPEDEVCASCEAPPPSPYPNYKIGLVLAVEAIPKTKLKQLKVDVTGNGEEGALTIVTNAKNITEAGVKVVVACVGANVVVDGEEIEVKATAVGGRKSQGMLCDSPMLRWKGGGAGTAVTLTGDEIQSNRIATDAVALDRNNLSAKIDSKLKDRKPTGIKADDEFAAREARLKEVQMLIVSMRSQLDQDRKSISDLRAQAHHRRAILQSAKDSLATANKHCQLQLSRELKESRDRYKSTADVLVQSRRLLVRELVSVFRLRRVQRNHTNSGSTGTSSIAGSSSSSGFGKPSGSGSQTDVSKKSKGNEKGILAGVTAQLLDVAGVAGLTRSLPPYAPATPLPETDSMFDDEDDFEMPKKSPTKARPMSPNASLAAKLFYEEPQEYRIINVGFSTYGDYLSYPREKFNAGLGHVVHMTIIMAHYLGITLPFPIVYRGSKSCIKSVHQISPSLINKGNPAASSTPSSLSQSK
ncbi:hypothetical protein HDV05_000252 [Chytridiales sp. JEL 0842]|nr:hypothetical protein HDV05_000252 [Chytridiales sp. JEL 0842]